LKVFQKMATFTIFAPWTPPGQKVHRSIVELHFDTRARLAREKNSEVINTNG
jgi:hypothetical protein